MQQLSEGRKARELDRIAFIAPKSAGMGRANEKEEQNERGQKDRDNAFGIFEELGIHLWRRDGVDKTGQRIVA